MTQDALTNSGFTRRQALTGLAASAIAARSRIPTTNTTTNLPSNVSTSSLSGDDRAQVSHLGSTWLRQTVIPKSGEVIDEFELSIVMDFRINDVTGLQGVGPQFELHFVTEKDSYELHPSWIKLTPLGDWLNSCVYVDALHPDGWKTTPIKETIDSAEAVDANTDLLTIRAKKIENGYYLTVDWQYRYSESDLDLAVIRSTQTAFFLPLESLYGIAPTLIDQKDFRESNGTPLRDFATGIHHLNTVSAGVAITKFSTPSQPTFAASNIQIVRSGSVYESNVHTSSGDYKVLMVEPSAADFQLVRGVRLSAIDISPSQHRNLIEDQAGSEVGSRALYPSDMPTCIRNFSTTSDQPFAIQITLGHLNAKRDFENTVALVKGTNFVTWVAPTINSSLRIKEILAGIDLADPNNKNFPLIRKGQSAERFTPKDLFLGLNNINDLRIKLYQEERVGFDSEGNHPTYKVTAVLNVVGDQLYDGHVLLPNDFDTKKPILYKVGNGEERVLRNTKGFYPVIDPPTQSLCKPPIERINPA